MFSVRLQDGAESESRGGKYFAENALMLLEILSLFNLVPNPFQSGGFVLVVSFIAFAVKCATNCKHLGLIDHVILEHYNAALS